MHSLLSRMMQIPRIMDNIHVDPFSGTVYAAAFPSIPELLKAFAGKGHSPTEIWAVKNSTDSASLSRFAPLLASNLLKAKKPR